MRKPPHNCRICLGDRYDPPHQDSIESIIRRIDKWSDSFLNKIIKENSSQNWITAAKLVLHSRSS